MIDTNRRYIFKKVAHSLKSQKSAHVMHAYAKLDATQIMKITKKEEHEVERGHHNALLNANLKTSLVYVLRVQEFEDESFIIKVGFTKGDLKERIDHASSNYGCNALLLDVFPCHNSFPLEQAVLHHPRFLSIKFTDVVNDTSKSIETFHVKTLDEYAVLKKIIKKEWRSVKYHFFSAEEVKVQVLQARLDGIEKDRIANETIHLTNQTIKLNNEKNLIENQAIHQTKIIDERALLFGIFKDDTVGLLKMIEIIGKTYTTQDNKVPASDEQAPTVPSHKKHKQISQIDPATKLVVKTYKSMTDLRKDFQISPLTIKKAIESRKIARDFCWAYSDE